jgi:hypothetical protein
MIKLVMPYDKKMNETNAKLDSIIDGYIQNTNSTGCNKTDYYLLYHNIRSNKFKTILECGTGVTTIAIAYALYENYKETNNKGIVYSMEENIKYYKQAVNLVPIFLQPFISINYSKVTYDYYSVFRGVKYKNIPKKNYDFCFIDGPVFKIKNIKGRLTFDFDLLDILNDDPIYGFVDGRNINCWVFKQIFGDKFTYIPEYGIVGVINGITRSDLEKISFGKFYENKLLGID